MIRVIILLIYIVLLIIRAIAVVITKIGGVLFYIIGFLLLILTASCYYLEIESGPGIQQMLIGTGVMFIIPQATAILLGILSGAVDWFGSRIER